MQQPGRITITLDDKLKHTVEQVFEVFTDTIFLVDRCRADAVKLPLQIDEVQ